MGVTGQNLIKYSFLDLVYKGILKIHKDWRQSHPRDPRLRLYTLVAKGPNFESYSSKIHQDPFVGPFHGNDDEFQVKGFVQSIYKQCEEFIGFKTKYVYRELKHNGLFGTSLGLKKVNIFFLNGNGKSVKRELNNELLVAEKNLPKYAKEDPEKAKNLIAGLGANIMLLNSFNDELVESLKPIFNDLGKTDTFESTGYLETGPDWTDILFYSFLDTLETFDYSFESFDSTFDFGGGFGEVSGDFGDIGDIGDF